MLVGLGATSWAVGTSVAVFTLLSGIASAFLLLIHALNGQHYNYVSILAVVVALDSFNSFASQIYTLFNFSKVMLDAFKMATEYFQCHGAEPLPLFTTPDKVVSTFLSIQIFLINSQGLLFFYWSLILFASSWSLSPVWWKSQRVIMATKVSCLVFPVLQLGLLQVKAVQSNDFANLLVMNVTILASIGMGSVFLVLTLMHVISVHREARGSTIVRLSKTYDGVVEFWPREAEENEEAEKNTSSGFMKLGKRSDSGLIARIVLAFVMVEGLSIYMIVMQIFYLQRWAHFKNEWRQGLSEPDIDQAEQFANLCSPIPGSLTGYLFLLVFGTTAESRAQIKRVFRTVFCCGFNRTKTGYQGLIDDNPLNGQHLNFKPFVCPRPPRPHTCLLNDTSTLAGTTNDSSSINTESTTSPSTVPALRSSPTLGGVALTITPPLPVSHRRTRSSIAEGFDFEFPQSSIRQQYLRYFQQPQHQHHYSPLSPSDVIGQIQGWGAQQSVRALARDTYMYNYRQFSAPSPPAAVHHTNEFNMPLPANVYTRREGL